MTVSELMMVANTLANHKIIVLKIKIYYKLHLQMCPSDQELSVRWTVNFTSFSYKIMSLIRC